MTAITRNLQAVRHRIAAAAARSGRKPGDIVLVAVSKTVPASYIEEAHRAGQTTFGESYLQEGVTKITELAHLPVEWHFIGPIQSNKTRAIAEHFHWVHSVDRLKIAQRLSDARPVTGPALDICLQVNVSGEATKSGIAPEQALDLARAVARLPRLRLRGLMAIPEPTEDRPLRHARFAALRVLQERINAAGLHLDSLSMGMTDDLEAAIAEGATIVRVGRAIFGERVRTA
jgi:pyridoxal phosphate enzyme (YggS family)